MSTERFKNTVRKTSKDFWMHFSKNFTIIFSIFFSWNSTKGWSRYDVHNHSGVLRPLPPLSRFDTESVTLSQTPLPPPPLMNVILEWTQGFSRSISKFFFRKLLEISLKIPSRFSQVELPQLFLYKFKEVYFCDFLMDSTGFFLGFFFRGFF